MVVDARKCGGEVWTLLSHANVAIFSMQKSPDALFFPITQIYCQINKPSDTIYVKWLQAERRGARHAMGFADLAECKLPLPPPSKRLRILCFANPKATEAKVDLLLRLK